MSETDRSISQAISLFPNLPQKEPIKQSCGSFHNSVGVWNIGVDINKSTYPFVNQRLSSKVYDNKQDKTDKTVGNEK